MRVEDKNGFTRVPVEQAQPAILERVMHYGIALLSIRHAHHIGALWTDLESYAASCWVAFNFVYSRPRLAPYGASVPLLGTNAMAIAIPDGEGRVLGWDQASSVMSLNEVKQDTLREKPLPEG